MFLVDNRRKTTRRMVDAFVVGRLNIDLFAAPVNTALRTAQTFERALGGFAGNVATALARLGVQAGVVSRVGDDGHGQFARDFLVSEGVDVRFVGTDPYWPTPVAFVESWPPDRFPITYYRRPTAADWQIGPGDLDLSEISAAPLLYVSGTGFAQSPSAETSYEVMAAHRGTTILDLDYRPALWSSPHAYRGWMTTAATQADIVIGNEEEIATAHVQVTGAQALIVKRGGNGARVHAGADVTTVEPMRVEVVNGLGAGDAFAAAVGYALRQGRGLAEAARLGNVAGAIVASRLTCSTSMPTAAELEQEQRRIPS
jgi:5-dehydro-2-deoxygluconokinase